MLRFALAAVLLALAPIALAPPVAAEPPAPRLDGARVLLLVGSGAGSQSEALARLFGEELEARFGARVRVELDGAAGGKAAANALARRPADGSVLGFVPTGLVYATLLREEGVAFDLAAFGWLGSFSRDRRALLLSGSAGAEGFADAAARAVPLTLAATSAASPGYYEPLLVNHLTGSRLRPIPGFAGGARMLAVASGEVDGLVGSVDGLASLLDLPGARLALRLEAGPSEDDVPTLGALADGPDAAALLDLVDAHARFGRIVALPPGASEETLAAWRARFDAVVADPEFRARAQSRGFLVEPTAGVEVARRMTALVGGDLDAASDLLARAIACGRAVAEGDAACRAAPAR